MIITSTESLPGVRDIHHCRELGGVEIYRAGTGLGQEQWTIPDGEYAIVLGVDDPVAIVGSCAQLCRVINVLSDDLAILRAEEALAARDAQLKTLPAGADQ